MNQKENTRRDFLKAAGVGGAALALSTLLPAGLVSAADTREAAQLRSVPNVASLLALDTGALQDGEKILVGGYYSEGDGGEKLVAWRKQSTRADNGGTVHSPFPSASQAGRFEVVHDGVVHFGMFGLFDETKAADDAFLAMYNDLSVRKIEARNDLLFTRRNELTRSQIELDFLGHKVVSYGIETPPKDSPTSAVFSFTGHAVGTGYNYTLKNDMPEYFDVYEVNDSSKFVIGDWYQLTCDVNPGGSSDRELQKLAQVIEVVDPTHVRFDYKLGWPLAAGRRINYQKYEPITDITVRNMFFQGNGRPTTTAGGSGSAPFSFEGAVRCDVYNCHATQTFWPMIFRRYNSYYVNERCSLQNPVEIQVGGTGYLTQQIGCMYGVTRDCYAHKMRHLTDFTGCAYSEVENCHAIGDNMGPFGTHGQYEHDLLFVGNSGLIGLTNTMKNWGRAAKNVTIKRHSGCAVLVQNYVTNVTIEDCQTFREDGMVYAGMIKANVDGLVIRNCHAETMLMLSQYGKRASRPTLLEDCTFNMIAGEPFGRIGAHVTSGEQLGDDAEKIKSPVTFRGCRLSKIDGNAFHSVGELNFEYCKLTGASESAKPIETECSLLRLTGCEVENVGFALTGEAAQAVRCDRGTKFTGSSTVPAIAVSNTAAPVSIDFDSITFDRGESGMLLSAVEGSKLSRIRIVSSLLLGGRSHAYASCYQKNTPGLLSNCVLSGYRPGSLPEKTLRSGNLELR